MIFKVWIYLEQIQSKINTQLFNERFFIISNSLIQLLNHLTLVLNEGLLIDFLQKKIIDKWLRFFVIFSTNIFNERFVFEYLYQLYIISLLVPLRSFYGLNNNSILNLLSLFSFFFLFLVILILVLYVLI